MIHEPIRTSSTSINASPSQHRRVEVQLTGIILGLILCNSEYFGTVKLSITYLGHKLVNKLQT